MASRQIEAAYVSLDVPREDWGLASGAVIAFAHSLVVPAGAHVNKPLRLKQFQIDFIRDVYNRQEGGKLETAQAVLSVARRNGKALALDTPIPTPSGTTTMGRLRTGERVLGSDGRPVRVLAVHPVMIGRPCYRVTFADGDQVVCDGDHLWTVRRRGGHSHSIVTVPTSEMAADFNMQRPDGRTERRYAVKAPPAVVGETSDLPLPPYELGVWLGDGSKHSAYVTLNERDAPEILCQFGEAVTAEAPSPGSANVRISSGDRSQAARNLSFQARLREAGLILNKHIPELYFSAPIEIRWRLLQGMFDTDGHINVQGQADQIFKSHELAFQFVRLLRSLGVKAADPQAKEVSISGRVMGTYWRVTFYPYTDQPVATLDRHLCRRRVRPQTRDMSRTITIVNIEPVPSVPVRCITVDAPDKLYLCGQYKPTHNTLLAAVIVLVHLAGPFKKPNATLVSAATTREQASIVFRFVRDMVRVNATLGERLKVIDSTKRIIHRTDGSVYRAISAEAGGQFGLGLDLVVYDELGQAKNRALYDALMTSLGSQSEPLMLIISTQAASNEHLLSELIDYGEKVNKGVIPDRSFVCHLHSTPKDAPLMDEAGWYAANPGLGDYRSLEEMRRTMARAEKIPSFENSCRVYYLNQRVGSESPFLSVDVWEACAGEIDTAIFTDGRPVYGGLDLSARADLTALVLAAADDEDRLHLWPFVWTPQDSLADRAERDRVPYETWVRQDQLMTTPGSTVDYDWVAAEVAEITAGMNIARVNYDRWRIDIFRQALARQGYALPLLPFGQGYRDMSPAVEAFEEAALSGKLAHGGHPVLRLCVANAVVSRDPAGNRKLDKAKAYGRIDAAVAAVMAVGACKASGEPVLDVAGMIG